jgi:hypothetical protein
MFLIATLTVLLALTPALAAQELTGNSKVIQVIKPQSSSTAVTSAAVDLSGYQEAMIVLSCGTTASTGTLDVKVQSSATTGGTYADITGAVFTQVTPSNDDAVYVARIRVAPSKPFIKVVATAATAASIYGVEAVGWAKAGGGYPLQTAAFNKATTD